MNKQIIVDGVDVSECKYFSKYQKIVRNNECIVDMQNACIEEIKTKPCSQKHNCYFKNWQRKEQECEELKKQCNCYACGTCNGKEDYRNLERHHIGLRKSFDELHKQLDQLKAENKILKEKLEIAIKNNMDKTLLRLKNGDVQEELQEIREQFGIETLYFHDDNTRVHRCLDVLRLKNILTEIKEIIHFNKTNRLSGGACISIEQILQKISEVENG